MPAWRRGARILLASALCLVISLIAPAIEPASANEVEERIAQFWKRVDALGPSDLVTAADLGAWANNVIARDSRAGISVADFRAATAGMQAGFDRAGIGIAPGAPRSRDVEARIARFWQRLDALGPNDLVTAADLGEWALNVTDRDPNKRITVADFRASTARMQSGLDHARSLRRTPAPPSADQTPTQDPDRPTPAPRPPEASGTTITNGQDANVPCGTGAAAIRATVSGIRSGLNGLIVGDTATIRVTAPSGATLRWVFGGPGALRIDGCTATYAVTSIGTAYQTSATIRIMRAIVATPTPSPTPECGTSPSQTAPAFRCPTTAPTGAESGPQNVVIDETIKINVYDPANRPGGATCGNEYLQVSLSGPYSYSINTFWIRGPGTNWAWAGPFTNVRTFQPIATGRYEVAVDWADAENRNYIATVGRCGFARVIKSKQGWGVPVP